MKITKIDNQGRGIGYDHGKIIFVENTLPGEDITYKCISEKSKYCVGIPLSIENESNIRVQPKCIYYNECGGCNLMHMGIEYEEEYKLDKVKSILKKYANIDEKIRLVKNNQELFYRNKITLKVKNNTFGYYNNSTHNFIEVSQCLLGTRIINDIISNHEFIDISEGEITIRCNYQNEILIAIRSDSKVTLKDNIPKYVVGIVVNDKTIYKDNYFYDLIGDYKFKISYNSFFQVNNYMANEIFNIIKNNLKGDNLLDLYCGVGTLGISVANNFKDIYGIELIDNAIVDAKENALINNISNAHFYAGDTAKILDKLDINIDTIIVDPPRSGLNKETLSHIERINPKVIAYVSCDPMTLARDLNMLKENYTIEKINALDMFPNTYHVECVCILNRKEQSYYDDENDK